MAKTYNRLELDVNKKFSGIITEVQGDSNSRFLDVSLFNNGVPLDLTGHEVKIFMEKPENGGEIWNDGVITDATAGRCEFLMTTEALSKVGHLQTQISVWKDNMEILSTQVFEILVTKTLLGNSSVESSNEYGTLVLLFQNLYEAHDLMTTMVQNIGLPAEVAAQYNLATMWQAWEFLVAYMKGDFTDKVDEAIANSSVQGVLDKIGNSVSEGKTLFNVLDDILEVTDDFVKKPNTIRTNFVRHQGTNTDATMFSISGKGKLHGFKFGANILNDTPKEILHVTVMADGNPIINKRCEFTNPNKGKVHINFADIYYFDLISTKELFNDEQMNTSSYYSSSGINSQIELVQTSDGNANAWFDIYTGKSISFNKSLEVWVGKAGSQIAFTNEFWVMYSLDE